MVLEMKDDMELQSLSKFIFQNIIKICLRVGIIQITRGCAGAGTLRNWPVE